MSEVGLYWMSTTRRAEESESVWGESGGKRDWKDFMSSVRCGGVLGDGGGKEARTSCAFMIFSSEYKLDEQRRRTKGGVRYSKPILRACFFVFSMSFESE